jgi:hypothetical protein
MAYEQLVDFLQNRTRIHVYQPVMLIALLREGGTHIEGSRAALRWEGDRGGAA